MFKKFKKKTVGFVSDIDVFLKEFANTHSPSKSQLAEIKKHERVHQLRDNPQLKASEKEIWEDF